MNNGLIKAFEFFVPLTLQNLFNPASKWCKTGVAAKARWPPERIVKCNGQ